jgi:hypothetical protein
MAAVPGLRVVAVNRLHYVGQIRKRRFGLEVVMRSHQVVGAPLDVMGLMRGCKSLEKAQSIDIISKNPLAMIAARHDVIDRPRVKDALWSSHGESKYKRLATLENAITLAFARSHLGRMENIDHGGRRQV